MRYVLLSAVFTAAAGSVAAGQPLERSPATVTVTLPADAELTIDGQATRSTSGQRRFITPPLEREQDFWYTLTARFVRAGRTITVEQRVWVRAGRETLVSLDVPGDAFAPSGVPNGSRQEYGTASETGSYYADREPAGSGSGRSWRGPTTRGEARPYSPGINPSRWGTDPSDPFYGKGEW